MVPKDKKTITFSEVDKFDHPTSTYIYSVPSGTLSHRDGKKDIVTGRIDIAYASTPSKSWSLSSLRDVLIDVFLPAGYPHSVSDDYTPYQIFDSLQAFSSSIAGLLASRAVLQGVGVGNANASPTSALLLHILQDTSGRIATILFAHRVGTALEPECKMYRFAADIFNDLAMLLDCLSPMVPAGFNRVTVLSAAGVLRALCGVAGGSSKASLSAHFARWGNLAEVNAKDSSQETVISLIGMLVGSFVVSHITGFTATWLTLIFLLSMHLSLNYAAVRSVQMTTLNRQRANIVFSTLLSSDPDLADFVSSPNRKDKRRPSFQQQEHNHQNPNHIRSITPEQVAKEERIFAAGAALRWHSLSIPSSSSSSPLPEVRLLGWCQVGVSLRQFLSQAPYTTSSTSNTLKTSLPLDEITNLFHDEEYILSITPSSKTTFLGRTSTGISAAILLKRRDTSASTGIPNIKSKSNPHLKAWMHALLAAKILASSLAWSSHTKSYNLHSSNTLHVEHILRVLSRTLNYLNEGDRFETYIESLRRAGWEVDGDGEGCGSAMETRVGRRVVISSLGA
ncbi:vitamin B6 photo-protection and homoeostasis-domain-containing protein [Aspergillus spinulosporus]